MIPNLTVTAAATAAAFLLSACPARPPAAPSGVGPTTVESVVTDLGPASCRQEVDKSDPNEARYLICPGAAGYSLIVRRVDAGRRSIDVVDASQRRFPLDIQEVVTRHMASLDDKVEWRLSVQEGRRLPIALIVRVKAREDGNNPGQVTRTLVAVAKITPGEVCITDRNPEPAQQAEAELRRTADSAPSRPCAPALPRVVEGGVVIR